MAAIDRGADFSIWSDDMRGAIRRRLNECGGIALITLAVIMAVALATWSVQDPSLSHATDAPVRNLLGTPGAIGSDLLMQLLGLASTVLVLPVAVWGWRIATHRSFDREWLRLAFWFIGTLLASAFVSCLPKTAKWPLPTGLGGVIGDALLAVPAALIGPIAGTTSLVVASILGAFALFAVIVAAGFGWRDPDAAMDDRPRRKARDEDEDERASISLGWLVHGFLSLKGHVLRLFGAGKVKPKKRKAAAPKTVARDRIDPKFENAAEEPEAEEEDGGEEEEDEEDSEVSIERPAARKAAKPKAPARANKGGYQLPALGLLAIAKANERFAPSQESIQETATSLESVLQDFGVRGEIINARPGPVVTLYELEPAPGIKSSRVIGLADDIALRLVKAGFVSLELFEGVEAGDLEGAGFSSEEAADVIARVTGHTSR